MLFFNGMVEVELGAEGEAGEDELSGVFLFAGRGAGVLEIVPDEAKMVVLGIVRVSLLGFGLVGLQTGPFVRTGGCRLESLSLIAGRETRPLLCHCQRTRFFSFP